MYLKKMNWPSETNCAVMITVNLDEKYFPRTFLPDIDVSETVNYRRMGQEGIELCLPRVLDILDERSIKATFFVPGKVAEEYPEMMRILVEKGHEVGCHGYEHEHMSKLTAYQQYAAIRKGKETIERVTGIEPVGFRAPEGEITLDTLRGAKNLGFKYSSSLHDNDIPYRLDLYSNEGSIIEIPNHWSCFDMPYFAFHFWPPVPTGQPRISCSDKVLTNWKWEYDGFYESGGCFVLQLNPQCIGSQGRIYMLEELLDYIIEKGNVWFATGRQVAEYYEGEG